MRKQIGGLTMTAEISADFVRLQVSGPPRLRDLLNLIDAISYDSQQWRANKLLIDLTRVQGRPDITGQALLGDHVGVKLAHLRKIASVVPQELITRNTECVARRRGANLRVFGEVEDAAAWLAAAEP